MAVSKVILNGTTLMDVTQDTVAAGNLLSGETAHKNDGTQVTGTYTPPASVTVESLNVTQNGTYTAPTGKAYSPVNVSVSGGGGGGDMSDPIRFFDYDGTLVASYKAVPGSLPSVPTHMGLKNGTWNYTLAQVTTQFNAMGSCDVGANYMTVSEDTEIDVVMPEGRLDPILTIAVNGTVTVDWGDNTTADTVTGTSLTTRQAVPHSYASAGAYTIVIHVVSGSFTFYGSSTYLLLRKDTSANTSRVYANCIHAVRLGSGITSIGQCAFYYCYSLASLTIPSGVTSIGNSAVYFCCSLASVSIPSTVTSIGTSAFSGCYSLASLSIPSTVTSIGNSAFSGCYSLASLTIPSGVTSIGTQAIYNCYSLASVSIPSTVTSIGENAFNSCYSLASLTIPSGVTSIGNSAFSNCNSLASLSIPSTVTSIGNSAFSGCFSLASLTIPSGVTSVGNSGFSNCYGMAEYHFKPTTPPTLGTTAFNGIPSDCKIYVPAASLSAYQTADNWSTYASYMVGE